MGGSRAASSLPGAFLLLASPHRSYGRCASRARSAVSRGISKNQYTRARRRRGREAKKKKEKTYSISRSPRCSSLPLSPSFLDASIPAFLSFLFLFFHYPLAKRIARNLSLSVSLSLSVFFSLALSRLRRSERAIEKGRRDRSVSRKRTRLGGSQRRSRESRPGGSAGEFIFSEAPPRARSI